MGFVTVHGLRASVKCRREESEKGEVNFADGFCVDWGWECATFHSSMKRLIALLSVLLCVSASFAKDKPNILWIVGENFSMDLACYGQTNVKTPHLDGLAREDVRYT